MKFALIVFKTIFTFLCIGCMFAYSQSLTDSYIIPKWLFAMGGILCVGAYYSVIELFGKALKIDFSFLGVSVFFICALQAVYGILQYLGVSSSHSVYEVTGSFENPAGFAACLCAGLPFGKFLLLEKRIRIIRYTGWIAGFVIMVAIALSHSRAGIVSIAILGCICLHGHLSDKRLLKNILLGTLALLLVGCYWMKKDSADGRLLIWKCGIHMVKDAPLLGHGVGSFEAHYMDYQADYFKQHEQSRFSMLADNVKQPFNEYLGILLNFGIVGLFVLLTLIGIIVSCYKKHPSAEKKVALYSLLSIGTFSLFSYPFTYPFVWIVTFLSVFMITGEYIKRLFTKVWIKNAVCISVLVCSLFGLYKLTERIRVELDWGTASTLALCKSYDEAIPTYEKLEKVFEDNPYFLYNYAAILQEMKQYDESLQVALKCRQYWADYDLELIIGENYQQLGKPELAEKYYNSASMMCPSRFLPLYKLFHLYKESSDTQQALAMAEILISKPMKIETTTIRMMKREMEREKMKWNESTK